MRKVFGGLMLSALVWLASGEAMARDPLELAGGRMAQFKSDTPIRVVPATPAQPAAPDQPAPGGQLAAPKIIGTTRSTSVGGLGLAIPATRVSDDALVGIISYTADRLGQRCGRVDTLVWPGIGLHSPEGMRIHLAINQALQIEGYSYVERELPPSQDREMAQVEAKITAYSAESSDRNAKDRHIIAVWYRETSDLHLILCPASPKPAPKQED